MVVPWARRSENFTHENMSFLVRWIGISAISQIWAGPQNLATLTGVMWALITAGFMWAVVEFFRRLPELLSRLLSRARFYNILVTRLRAVLVLLHPIHHEFALPAPGDGDPARPLQLRI